MYQYLFIKTKEVRTEIFEELQRAGTIDAFMYDSIKPSLEDFLKVTDENFSTNLAVYDKNKVVAFFLVCPQMGKSGHLHFCFTREYFSQATEVFRKAFTCLFDYGFESFIGITPVVYRHIFPMLKKLGVTITEGQVDSYCYFAKKNKYYPAKISHLNKKEFLNGRSI